MIATRRLGLVLLFVVLIGVYHVGRHTRHKLAAAALQDPTPWQEPPPFAGYRLAGDAALPPVAEFSQGDGPADAHASRTWPPVATFSILGYDSDTGEIGGAVQSRVFSVGNGVLWGEAEVGMVATQAYVDVSYGPQCLKLLRKGLPLDKIVEQVLHDDPDPSPVDWPRSARQFAVMNADGQYRAFTGEKAIPWAGHTGGKFVTAQGNILAGEEVVKAMVRTFEETEGHLSLRLLAALEAGQKAGGDKRGMQSAIMLVVKKGGGVWLNNDVVLRLQVDDHEHPIKELRRLVEKANRQFRLGQGRASKR